MNDVNTRSFHTSSVFTCPFEQHVVIVNTIRDYTWFFIQVVARFNIRFDDACNHRFQHRGDLFIPADQGAGRLPEDILPERRHEVLPCIFRK